MERCVDRERESLSEYGGIADHRESTAEPARDKLNINNLERGVAAGETK